jgi:gamma-glutamyltranspeptidase/glutathione hydrolase
VDSLGWNSSDYIHLLTEVERRAYADRAEHMGDSDFWDVPLEMLTSKVYANTRINDISLEIATPSSAVFASGAPGYESRETTHYSVVDQWGNAVSVTTTINLSYGGGHLVKGAGFFLNNEMDDFSSKPGVSNAYGLVGNNANAIEPGKRPLSSMTPTIVLKDGKPFIVIGSPGGSTIITTTMQVILNVVVYGMDIKEAVTSPRFHSQWVPDVIMTEPRGLSRDVIQNLESKGHILAPYKWGYIGEANGILITEDGFYGGGDSRGETSAIGY